mmetsp:Transcript_59271/g.130081  ORF Transcript_59271/g.130081 Transcript_59271/m.130081 type:complete len:203 (-) Transcript_59271:222-830(-)
MYLLIFFVTLALKLVDAFRGCSSFKRMPMVSFFFSVPICGCASSFCACRYRRPNPLQTCRRRSCHRNRRTRRPSSPSSRPTCSNSARCWTETWSPGATPLATCRGRWVCVGAPTSTSRRAPSGWTDALGPAPPMVPWREACHRTSLPSKTASWWSGSESPAGWLSDLGSSSSSSCMLFEAPKAPEPFSSSVHSDTVSIVFRA